jgi:hypothetical protein
VAAYASSASTDMAAYDDFPSHHLLAVRNLIATTNDESYHGSMLTVNFRQPRILVIYWFQL